MTPQVEEALGILQEECAEVIVEVSKIRRFGIDSTHYTTGVKHTKMLETEVGDVLSLVKFLIENGVLTEEGLASATEAKTEKLKKWSTIFNKD